MHWTNDVRHIANLNSVRLARENPTWGYNRIQGALACTMMISDTLVGNILKASGIEPAAERNRKTSWRTILKARRRRLEYRRTCHRLPAVCQPHRTRGFRLAASALSPINTWTKQVSKSLTGSIYQPRNRTRNLPMNWVTTHCNGFCKILKQERIKFLRLPPRSPNFITHTDRMIILGKDSVPGGGNLVHRHPSPGQKSSGLGKQGSTRRRSGRDPGRSPSLRTAGRIPVLQSLPRRLSRATIDVASRCSTALRVKMRANSALSSVRTTARTTAAAALGGFSRTLNQRS